MNEFKHNEVNWSWGNAAALFCSAQGTKISFDDIAHFLIVWQHTLNKPCRTCDQSYVGVFGIIGTPGHPTDCVSQHLQSVSLLNHTHTNTIRCMHQSGYSKQYEYIYSSIMKTNHKRMAIRECYHKCKLMIHWRQLGTAANNKRVPFSSINNTHRRIHIYASTSTRVHFNKIGSSCNKISVILSLSITQTQTV